MAKISQAILVAAVAVWPIGTFAQSDKDDDYATYSKTRELGAEMFAKFLVENVVTIRVAETLRFCSKDGLASVADKTESDSNFLQTLNRMIHDGKFDGLPHYAFLEAQNVANGMAAGYRVGFREALKLTASGDPLKTSLCAVAVNGANKILTK